MSRVFHLEDAPPRFVELCTEHARPLLERGIKVAMYRAGASDGLPLPGLWNLDIAGETFHDLTEGQVIDVLTKRSAQCNSGS